MKKLLFIIVTAVLFFGCRGVKTFDIRELSRGVELSRSLEDSKNSISGDRKSASGGVIDREDESKPRIKEASPKVEISLDKEQVEVLQNAQTNFEQGRDSLNNLLEQFPLQRPPNRFVGARVKPKSSQPPDKLKMAFTQRDVDSSMILELIIVISSFILAGLGVTLKKKRDSK